GDGSVIALVAVHAGRRGLDRGLDLVRECISRSCSKRDLIRHRYGIGVRRQYVAGQARDGCHLLKNRTIAGEDRVARSPNADRNPRDAGILLHQMPHDGDGTLHRYRLNSVNDPTTRSLGPSDAAPAAAGGVCAWPCAESEMSK